MSLARKARYYCINTAKGCRYAAGDVPFSARYVKKYEGRCRGKSADGCGAPLALGDPEDLRPRWFLFGIVAVAAVIGGDWFLQATLFPPPLEHVTFAATEARTEDGAGLLDLKIVRDRDLQRRIEVEYASADGSAKAGEDYQPVRDRLTFEPGEGAKTIRVMLEIGRAHV